MKEEKRRKRGGGRGEGHKGYRIKVIRVVLRLLMPKGGWRLTGRSVARWMRRSYAGGRLPSSLLMALVPLEAP